MLHDTGYQKIYAQLISLDFAWKGTILPILQRNNSYQNAYPYIILDSTQKYANGLLLEVKYMKYLFTDIVNILPKNPTKLVGLLQSWPHHHLIEN